MRRVPPLQRLDREGYGDVRSAEGGVLALQKTAGNQAVTAMLDLQRKAPVAAKAKPKPRPKKPKKATAENYAAFLIALEWMGANWPVLKDQSAMQASASAAHFGLEEDVQYLNEYHKALLLDVLWAIRARNHNEWDAFEKWQSLGGKVRSEVMAASGAARMKFDPSGARTAITQLDAAFPRERAYAAVRAQKKLEFRPHAPDAVKLKDLPKVTEAFFEAKKLYEDTVKLASSGLGDAGTPASTVRITPTGGQQMSKTAGALIDILASSVSAEEKFKEARKKLDIFSASDFVNKVLSATSGIMGSTAELGSAWAEKVVAASLAKSASKDVVRYKSILAKYQNLGKMAQQVGNVATAISIVTNYAKFVKAIWERKWDDILSSGADLGIDLAGLAAAGTAGGAALVAGSVIVVKATLEAVHLAAEFIRWCEDETVRVAAEEFMKLSTDFAKGYAWNLVANAEIVYDPDKEAVHDIAGQQMEILVPKVQAGMRVLNSHVTATTKTTIGGHGAVKLALGDKARQALAMPADDGLTLVWQLHEVFKGVDKMARYVAKNYTN